MIDPPDVTKVSEWLTIINTIILSLLGTGTIIYNRITDARLQAEQKRRAAEHAILSSKVDGIVDAVNGPLTAALGVASTAARTLAEVQSTPENILAAENAEALRNSHNAALHSASVASRSNVK